MEKAENIFSAILNSIDYVCLLLAIVYSVLAAMGDRYDEAIFFLLLFVVLAFISGKININGTAEVVEPNK